MRKQQSCLIVLGLLASVCLADGPTTMPASADQPQLRVLISRLESDDATTRVRAAWDLSWLGHVEAVKPLIAALDRCESTIDARVYVCALGEIQDPRAVKPLAKLLNSKDKGLARAAARALGTIGGEEAADCLIEALADPPLPVPDLLYPLAQCNEPKVIPVFLDYFERVGPSLRIELGLLLVRLLENIPLPEKFDVAPWVARFASGDRLMRAVITAIIGQSRSPKAVSYLSFVLSHASGGSHTERAALQGLFCQNDPKGNELLRKWLIRHPDSPNTVNIIRKMSEVNRPGTWDLLLLCAASAEPAARAYCFTRLTTRFSPDPESFPGRKGHPGDRVDGRFWSDGKFLKNWPRLRDAAAMLPVRARMGDPLAKDALEFYSGHHLPKIRLMAANLLHLGPREWSIARLLKLIEDRSARVRLAAARSLSCWGNLPDVAVEALKRHRLDECFPMRSAVKHALRETGNWPVHPEPTDEF
ncbi:MAG: HEAT repeat domain-containing protein [Phycisphaerae bacterium]